jgi:hypothetical protein
MAMISAADARLVVQFFEVMQRGFKEDANEGVKNEGTIAFDKLRAVLAKHGLDLSDIPAIQQRHAQNEAAKPTKKTASTSSTATASDQPNVFELIAHVCRGYSDIQAHDYVAAALWILHTHVYDRFQITPRLAVLSPVRGSGKTKMLMLIEKLASNPERHDNITAPSIYRLIDQGTPTLLLDEGDNLGLKIDRVMRSVLNSGHLRGGKITRVIQGEPKAFSTFAPAAVAAIGTLSLPLLHRSIVIRMHRTLRTDLMTTEMMQTPAETKRFEALRRLIVAWAQGAQFDPDPNLPKVLRGRAADNWRVLISIADSFGNEFWSKAAREAAIAFADGYHDEDACVALLFDIRTIFLRPGVDRIKSAALATALHNLEDGAGIWSAWRGESDDQSPHAITPGEIATLLRRFDRNLRPKTLFEQIGSHKTRGKAGRGYYRDQFRPWWKIYCPEGDEDAETDAENVRRLRSKSK